MSRNDRTYARQQFAFLVLWAIGLVGMGAPMVLLSQGGQMGSDGFYAGLFFLFLGLLMITRGTYWLVFRPEKLSIARQSRLEKSRKNGGLFSQDFSAWQLCRKHPVLGFVFLGSVVGLIAFLVVALPWLDFTKGTPILRVYLVSFAAWAILLAGYLAMAKILVSLYFPHRRLAFVGFLRDFARSIPYIAVLAAIWTVLILLRSEDDDADSLGQRILVRLNQLSLYAAFVVFKYYTYVNLACIAAGESRSGLSFGKAKQFMSSQRRALVGVWTRSGIGMMVVLAFVTELWLWNECLHWVDSVWMLSALLVAALVTACAALVSEQLAVLVLYLGLSSER